MTAAEASLPQTEIALRTFAMPADANANGDIFGGWLLSQMDLAGAAVAMRRCHSKVATVAIAAMSFHRPVYIGDELTCYGTIERVGRTSITVKVESWVRRGRGVNDDHPVAVTDGIFTYVSIDEAGKPRPVQPEK